MGAPATSVEDTSYARRSHLPSSHRIYREQSYDAADILEFMVSEGRVTIEGIKLTAEVMNEKNFNREDS